MNSAARQPDTAKEKVLCEALGNLKSHLDLSNEVIGNIIGLDKSSVSRCFQSGEFSHKGKVNESSLLLIRIYRALFALLGGNKDQMKHWLNTDNNHVQGVPLEKMQTVQGLVRTLEYLDAIRGKI